MTAIAVKISGKNSITTHLSNGGTVKTLAEVYDDPAERVEVIKKLSAAALTASHVLHDHIEGFIGEIGFDFGIDQNGKVWMFEANSRPGRSIFLIQICIMLILLQNEEVLNTRHIYLRRQSHLRKHCGLRNLSAFLIKRAYLYPKLGQTAYLGLFNDVLKQ